MSASAIPSVKTIFSKNEWEQMYPRKEYGAKSLRVRQLTLHFLIALDQPDRTIMPLIENWKTKNIQMLKAADPKNAKITPLMVAVMKGRAAVAERLIDSLPKDALNAADAHGWTALHHAAISSREIYDTLIRNGANANAKNELNGTAKDLIELTNREMKPISKSKVSFIRPNGKKVFATEKNLGIEHYFDLPFYPESSLKHLWNPSEPSNSLPRQFFHEFVYNPPSLVIRPCSALKGKAPHVLELVSDARIPLGKVIGTYGGTVRNESPKITCWADHFDPALDSELYVLGNVDASTSGNPIRFANWGWPNSAMLSTVDQGTPIYLLAVVEDEGIKPGEPILWDYGLKEFRIAFDRFVLMGKEKMHAFFSVGLEQQLKNYDDALQSVDNSNLREVFKIYALYSRILFPLNTPAALLDLHYSGIVPADQWQPYLYYNKNQLIFEWLEQQQANLSAVRGLILRILELEVVLNRENKEPISRWLLDQIGELTIMQILKAMEIIFEGLLRRISYQEILSGLPDQLEGYDWTKDEEGPLSFNRTVEDLYKFMSSNPRQIILPQLLEQREKLREGGHQDQESYRRLDIVISRLTS